MLIKVSTELKVLISCSSEESTFYLLILFVVSLQGGVGKPDQGWGLLLVHFTSWLYRVSLKS